MIFAPSPGASGLTDLDERLISSTPSINEFNPFIIPYQWQVIELIQGGKYNYDDGILEVLLSGSVGSAKSILAAHIALMHVNTNPGARLCLCRRSLPDLKATILQKVLEHMEGVLIEGEDYEFNRTSSIITFKNSSQIICKSWADKRYLKFRSLELSAAIFEELTENDDEDYAAYRECNARVGRLPHVKENFILNLTNPDSPRHWAYKYFFIDQKASRRVFLSKTQDNPFLPKSYVNKLAENLDPKMARRLLHGEWIEIETDSVYYNYNSTLQFKKDDYKIDPSQPIRLSFDFNIGIGKPMSSCAFQMIDDEMHIFDENILDRASTEDTMNVWADKGVFELSNHFVIHGDSAGKNLDTRSKRSDYDIIVTYLTKYRRKNGSAPSYELQMVHSNPPIRTRHNMVNAYCKNAAGRTRLWIYRKAKTCDEGLRLTALVNSGSYIEDDSKRYQHVTTAIGYGLHQAIVFRGRKVQTTIQL